MNQNTDSNKRLIGIDLTTSNLNAVCIEKNGTIVGSESQTVSSNTEIEAQLTTFLSLLKEKFGKFERCGLALSGLIDRKKNRVALSTRYPQFVNVDLVKNVKSAVGVEVVLENDGNAGALGEFTFGAGRGADSMLYIGLGDGVAGAFVFHGRLWRGVSGFSGELGHIKVDAEQGRTLGNVASVPSILERIKTRFHQDQTSSLAKIAEESLTIEDVLKAANAGDDFAQMMLERTGVFMGNAIATVINLLNIEKIVVCGDAMAAGEFILKGIRDSAEKQCFGPSYETVEIVAGELLGNAVSMGAALGADA